MAHWDVGWWRRIRALSIAVALALHVSDAAGGSRERVRLPAVEDPFLALVALARRELKAGRPANAVRILEAVHAQRPSAAVRLALADAYVAADRLADAERLFRRVLNDPSASTTLRGRAQRRLAALRRMRRDWGLALAWISDSNPVNFTERRTVRIAGQTLTVVKPEAARPRKGVQLSLHARQALSEDARLQLRLSVDLREFPGRIVDEEVVSARLSRTFGWRRDAVVSLGQEAGFLAGRSLYRYPHVQVAVRGTRVPGADGHLALRAGRLDVARLDYLDAWLLSLEATIRLSGRAPAGVTGGLYAERGLAREPAYSFRSGALSLLVERRLWGRTYGRVSFLLLARAYDATDPLFGVRRRDLRRRATATIRLPSLPGLQAFAPEIGVVNEINRSSIGYHSYSRTQAVFQLVLRR